MIDAPPDEDGRRKRGDVRLSYLYAVVGLVCVGCNERPLSTEDDDIPAEVRRYASARCKRLENCDCVSNTHATRAECEEDIFELYRGLVAEDREIHLACFDAAASQWSKPGCDEVPREQCVVTPPNRAIGESCSNRVFYDANFEELACIDGHCWDGTCVPSFEGGEGDPCSVNGYCTVRLACFDGICEPLRRLGEACQQTTDCSFEDQLRCEDGMCVERPSEGEPCGPEIGCAIPLQCVHGECTNQPSASCLSSDF
jgi:hypothetical protein